MDSQPGTPVTPVTPSSAPRLNLDPSSPTEIRSTAQLLYRRKQEQERVGNAVKALRAKGEASRADLRAAEAAAGQQAAALRAALRELGDAVENVREASRKIGAAVQGPVEQVGAHATCGSQATFVHRCPSCVGHITNAMCSCPDPQPQPPPQFIHISLSDEESTPPPAIPASASSQSSSQTQSSPVSSVSPAMTGPVHSSSRPIVVVKIGTSTLMRDSAASECRTVSQQAGRRLQSGEGELAVSTIALLVDTLLSLRREGYDVILVTSGAVGVGCRELGVKKRPTANVNSTADERKRVLATIQAYAAVGQSVLMRTYDHLMRMVNQQVAQVLLTAGDMGHIYQYYNAKNTLSALLDMGVIPIVNENDTVATEELKYGDNDWLSALVSSAVGAQWLFLLTDVDQLYTANPRVDPTAQPIDVVPNIECLKVNMRSNATGTQWGTGGMKTKITAARLATAAGVRVCLVHGSYPSRVLDFVYERPVKVGTIFEPLPTPLDMEKKKWISNCLPPRGEITISEKAATLVRAGFPIRTLGVVGCEGVFEANSAVRVRTETGLELARAICNLSSDDLWKFKGMGAEQILQKAGCPVNERVVHEDNLALLVRADEEEQLSPQLLNDRLAVSPKFV